MPLRAPLHLTRHVTGRDLYVYIYVGNYQWRTEGGVRGSNPSEIPKALQNRAKLNSIVKTVKNC